MKKAQGLSMTTIVVAAIALLVLVVLVLIFTGRLNLFSTGVQDSSKCETFCTSLGTDAKTDIAVGSETTCTNSKAENGHEGSIIPAISGKDKDHICCCIPKP